MPTKLSIADLKSGSKRAMLTVSDSLPLSVTARQEQGSFTPLNIGWEQVRTAHLKGRTMTAKFRQIMNRQNTLLVTALVAVTGYMIWSKSTDTLSKAANRFGNALVASDTDTIWTFVPQEERAFYSYDKEKFTKFWNSAIKPNLKKSDSFLVEAAGTNGLFVSLHTYNEKEFAPNFGLLVSGQKGKYYVPYLTAYASLAAATTDMTPGKVAKYVRFEHYLAWMDKNEALFKELGISRFRRGPAMQNQSIQEMRNSFKDAIAHEKQVGPVASR
jgi:hypothetical protein